MHSSSVLVNQLAPVISGEPPIQQGDSLCQVLLHGQVHPDELSQHPVHVQVLHRPEQKRYTKVLSAQIYTLYS